MIQQSHSWAYIWRKLEFEKIHAFQRYIAALFTIAKKWKQARCPSTDEWIKKMWYVCLCVYTHTHTPEYYSAIKKNEIMPFAATWMDLEIIILSEVSQAEKNKYHMISLKCGIKTK